MSTTAPTGVPDGPATAGTGLAARPVEPVAATGSRVAAALQRNGVAAFAALALLVLVGSVLWPSFHTLDNLRNTVLGNSYIGIVAIGMTLVIITGGIDLSVGSVFALGGVVGVYVSNQAGPVAAVLATILACGLIGLINGMLIGYAGMAPFIVTLATLFGVRGLVYQLTGAGARTYSVPSDSFFAHLGTGVFLTIGYPVLIAIALYVVFHVVLERTPFGLTTLAIGGGEDAAVLMGLKVRRTKVSLYVVSAALAGVAGMLQAAQLVSASPIIATGYELQAIAAVVIGGTLLTGGAGSLIGTAAGVLLLGTINAFIRELQLDSTWNNVVSGAFLVTVVVMQRLLNYRRAD
ncbi:ABC transporter permease [Cellulomonas sp. NTE-D12]|uniref:ABC transporter permease n=1 Tax=Cellulomonas sp. NTE-D12 TaxID=2962632 RepID=UPI003081D76F|nr:sugar ABC transporter permease [Cellulomonas sp. NTE-D12]